MNPDAWNPRYLAYCRSQHVQDPDEMLRLDRERWPGGLMCGFMLWIQDKWAIWKRGNGNPEILSDAHHDAFDKWLNEEVQRA